VLLFGAAMVNVPVPLALPCIVTLDIHVIHNGF
jgi:hypothetical protein